jgi:hypothetical protein
VLGGWIVNGAIRLTAGLEGIRLAEGDEYHSEVSDWERSKYLLAF